MTATDAPLGESMRARFAELETRRRLHIDGVDQAVQAMADLRALDRHLVDAGLHHELQLEHLDTEDPPLEELPEFQGEPMPSVDVPSGRIVFSTPGQPDVVAAVGEVVHLPAATPPPDSAEAEPVPAASPKSATARRFTPEQKAEAVRLAEELDSDNAAAKQLGTSATSISNWRKAGHGKRPKSTKATSKKAEPKAAEPAATGPTVKCKVCTEALPIVGEPSQVSRLAAHQDHWKAKPECGEAMRKRRA